ncbi:hypothetical protein Hypma_005933 [Hypsizygus marmoreus]|uniref:Uncharacterized protein n=1 Tax=Hypsizygus marmoreus TaxID=39966 RepID=A0A369KI79_HYPMA|nr:hypothetical protein Hypma_005933 [Hypsizygus marmoreus]
MRKASDSTQHSLELAKKKLTHNKVCKGIEIHNRHKKQHTSGIPTFYTPSDLGVRFPDFFRVQIDQGWSIFKYRGPVRGPH